MTSWGRSWTVAALTVAGWAGFSRYGQAQSPASDKTAFEAVCGKCHSASLVVDLRSQGEWEETVNKMVSLGAQGTDEQFDAVMRYLLKNLTKVNVNTAEPAELVPVLDINEAAAEALVKYRTQHGSFKSLDELKKAPGVNAEKLESLKEKIVF
jgi:competence protein ComEA